MFYNKCMQVYKCTDWWLLRFEQPSYVYIKPQLYSHDFGHNGATTHPDLSSRDALAWVVAAS